MNTFIESAPILEATDLLCPFKGIKRRDSTPAWFSKELIEMINRTKELMKQYL